MSGRKPWRPYSRYHKQWNDGSLALGYDGFTWDTPTPPAIVKRFAPKVSARDEAFWRQAATGKSAPIKPEPLPLRQLPPLNPRRAR